MPADNAGQSIEVNDVLVSFPPISELKAAVKNWMSGGLADALPVGISLEGENKELWPLPRGLLVRARGLSGPGTIPPGSPLVAPEAYDAWKAGEGALKTMICQVWRVGAEARRVLGFDAEPAASFVIVQRGELLWLLKLPGGDRLCLIHGTKNILGVVEE
jgi:hypothetical protein